MKHRLIHELLGVSLIVLAACSDTAGPESQIEYLATFDMAVVSADAIIADVGEQGQVSPRTDDAGIVTYYDGLGDVQEMFDELTTASIHIVREGGYEGGRENWSGAVTRSRATTITGLEGDETTRTVNGTGSSTVSRSRHSDENGYRSYDMTNTTIISDVVHGVPREMNLYPLSGTIIRDMTAVVVNGAAGDETRTRHVIITFNGTQFPAMTVNGEIFEVDLATREGNHPLRRGKGHGCFQRLDHGGGPGHPVRCR